MLLQGQGYDSHSQQWQGQQAVKANNAVPQQQHLSYCQVAGKSCHDPGQGQLQGRAPHRFQMLSHLSLTFLKAHQLFCELVTAYCIADGGVHYLHGNTPLGGYGPWVSPDAVLPSRHGKGLWWQEGPKEGSLLAASSTARQQLAGDVQASGVCNWHTAMTVAAMVVGMLPGGAEHLNPEKSVAARARRSSLALLIGRQRDFAHLNSFPMDKNHWYAH
ncbi:MAG: hypothetical protein FRX49_08264 [Trebouxia sp. A1-2]|nr:MAG: hypothetical protein FRX49_08264 [Trebouxia sp. A1-2]